MQLKTLENNIGHWSVYFKDGFIIKKDYQLRDLSLRQQNLNK